MGSDFQDVIHDLTITVPGNTQGKPILTLGGHGNLTSRWGIPLPDARQATSGAPRPYSVFHTAIAAMLSGRYARTVGQVPGMGLKCDIVTAILTNEVPA
jgi:hypothetical protein